MESNLEGISLLTLVFGIMFVREYSKTKVDGIAQLTLALIFFSVTFWIWHERWTEGLLWDEFEFMLYYFILFGFIWLVWKIVKRIRNK